MNYMFEVIWLALFFTSLLFIIIIIAFEYVVKRWMKEYRMEESMKHFQDKKENGEDICIES